MNTEHMIDHSLEEAARAYCIGRQVAWEAGYHFAGKYYFTIEKANTVYVASFLIDVGGAHRRVTLTVQEMDGKDLKVTVLHGLIMAARAEGRRQHTETMALRTEEEEE